MESRIRCWYVLARVENKANYRKPSDILDEKNGLMKATKLKQRCTE